MREARCPDDGGSHFSSAHFPPARALPHSHVMAVLVSLTRRTTSTFKHIDVALILQSHSHSHM